MLWPAVIEMEEGLKLKSTIETATSEVAEDDAVQVTGDVDEAALVWVAEEEEVLEEVWVFEPVLDVGVVEDMGLMPGMKMYTPSPASATTATTTAAATVPEIPWFLNMLRVL